MLGKIYCEEGGKEFWEAKREPCIQLGMEMAGILKERLTRKGRSLYVGAGVAEIPLLIMETEELDRLPEAYNLRKEEVSILNQACQTLKFTFQDRDASSAIGTFDHIWMVSVLNDPELFPELSTLTYGRANPVLFKSEKFTNERKQVFALSDACLKKLSLPGLVTTSVEEIPWITHWCEQENLHCVVEEEDYPTAIVEDPICFIQIEGM
jgi:hypothetical protein